MLPLPKDDKENQTKRRVPPKKVPSYHLTGAKVWSTLKKLMPEQRRKEKDKKTELVKKRSSKETQIRRKKGKTKQTVTVTLLKNRTFTRKPYPLDHLGHVTRYCES